MCLATVLLAQGNALRSASALCPRALVCAQLAAALWTPGVLSPHSPKQGNSLAQLTYVLCAFSTTPKLDLHSFAHWLECSFHLFQSLDSLCVLVLGWPALATAPVQPLSLFQCFPNDAEASSSSNSPLRIQQRHGPPFPLPPSSP